MKSAAVSSINNGVSLSAKSLSVVYLWPILDELALDLNSLLHTLRDQAKTQWYLFGLAFGVPQNILKQLEDYPESQCLIEVLDYWLRHHSGQPTWKEVTEAQKKVNCMHAHIMPNTSRWYLECNFTIQN